MDLSEIRSLSEQKTRPQGHSHLSSMSERLKRLYERPKQMVLVLVTSVMVAETAVMLLLACLFRHPLGWEGFIDGGALVILLSPIFYFFYFRPLKNHLAALKTSERQNKFLTRELITLAEEQQRKLAWDLHDEFGHALTSLVFGVEAVKSALPQQASESSRACDDLIIDLQALAHRIRAFSSELHPVVLDNLGIVDALHELIRKQQRLHPALRVDLQIYGLKDRLGLEMETVLYRICQEGLNNAIKHSHADRVQIRLTRSHPYLILTLEDNGIGFDTHNPHSNSEGGDRGIGLLGMRERVAMVGGSFKLLSRLAQGTLIRVELPVTLTGGEGP